MRLLHHLGDGDFRLEEFAEDNKPDYAILSHTWLMNGSEVTFGDLEMGNAQTKTASYDKVRFCIEQAAKDGLSYSWMDTCCIDKSSSAELQEAITIMFTWYRNAARCYVYLSDVSATESKSENHSISWESAFRQIRWFKRGWTLQELIAPKTVEFFSSQGIRLGNKKSLSDLIHQITRIPHSALQGANMDSFTVAERFSWMQGRQTKRTEDMAYSLLGIFGIFMPFMYGEGTHALTRLHEEIRKKHEAATRVNEMLLKLPVVPEAAFNSIENQYAATCLPDTRVELLRKITDWVDGPDKRCIFWLNGIAGTGKSTVARTISRIYQDRGYLGGSFFFSRRGGDSALADKLITILASQLSTKIPTVKQFIYDAMIEQPNIAAQSLRDQWDQLIMKPLSRSSQLATPSAILFVIDALEECASERDIRIILKLITASQSLTNIRLRILITSRPETPIRCGFSHISKAERQVVVLDEILPSIVDRDLSLFFEHNFMIMREELGFANDWPGMRIIKRLVEISSGLFIWASTACRFIREGRRLAKRRISTLVNRHSSGMGPEKQLDQIYTTILRASIGQDYSDEEKKELYVILREVLGSITILFSPLSIPSLSNLIPASLNEIKETLADLHAIFQVPDQMDRAVRFHHPTFRDFLFNRDRCSDLNFWVDKKKAHEAMAAHCIQLMSRVLKSDICGLRLPGTLLENIELRLIRDRITPELEYACRYWVQHYRESGTVLRDGDEAHRFFQKFFLNWLECMTLTGNASEVPSIIRSYAFLLVESDNSQAQWFVEDSRRFVIAFQSIIEVAPLQMYCAAVAFSPMANRLRGQFWGQMRRWVQDAQLAEAMGNETKGPETVGFFVNSMTFTPDGTQLASGSVENMVRLWDVATRSKRGSLTGPTHKVSSVTISPDGYFIAAGSDDASIMIWELATRTLCFTLLGHTRWVNSVVFSSNGKMLVSGGMDDTVRLWDVETGRELCKLEAKSSGISSVAVSPNGQRIASGSVDRIVRIWDFERKEIATFLDGHSGAVNCITYSPDGKLLVSGADDTTVKLWDANIGEEYMTLRGHRRRIMTVTISPNGRVIASGSEDSQIILWNAVTGSAIVKLNGHKSGINAVTFSPDGRLVASCSFDSKWKLWDAMTGEATGDFEDFGEDDLSIPSSAQNMAFLDPKATTLSKILKGHSSTVTTLTCSSAGNLVASGSHDTLIKIWSREGTQLALLRGHSDTISCLEFSPNNQWLASAALDRKACL
ncbi:hypothetical protein E8E14_003797 [Neopestalotiopsis sp. 37M]|nr:hypothetical protein E8E14_003797 [Neopestalotiopsis sp. 37M]